MHIYKITLKYHVTGVLKPESVGQLQRMGIVKVICTRPDIEAPVQEQSEQMRIAVTEARMAFGYNPVTMTSFSPKLVRRHTQMRLLIQMAASLPTAQRDGVVPCYGRLNLHTNARQRI